MTYFTHALGGAIAGSLVLMAADYTGTDELLIFSGAVIGSLLPDIDHRQSKISRSSAAATVTSWITSLFTKHRGVLHTPFFIILTSLVCGAGIIIIPGEVQTAVKLIMIGLIPGMWSHIILDTLNPGGIMWIYPLSRKYFNILPIKTGSILEAATAMMLAVLLYILLKWSGLFYAI